MTTPTFAPNQYRGSNEPPFVLPDTVELRADVPYLTARGRDWFLDLFLPRDSRPAAPAPAVVYVHGGGWAAGSRQQFWRQAAHMAARGVPGASIQYPFAPQHTFPAQLEHAQAAVRWLRRHAAELGIDPQRIGAAGGSAGAHIVALLGVTDAPKDGVSSRVQAVVSFNGIFDLTHHVKSPTVPQSSDPNDGVASNRVTDLVGGNPDIARAASPLLLADAQAAPMLLLHGDADTTIPYAQSQAMQRRLHDLGVRADLHLEPNAAHGFFNRSPYYERTISLMERFLSEVLRPAR